MKLTVLLKGMAMHLKKLSNLHFPTAICLLAFLFISSPLFGSLDTDVPEVPTIFSLFFHGQDSALANFFKSWETVIFSIASAIFVSIMFCLGAQYKDHLPKGFQNLIEYIIEAFRGLILEILGPKGEKYIPFLGTLFLYILAMNWLAVIPLAKPPSSNISITVALAICVFSLVQFLSIRNFGLFGYLYHLAGSPKGFVGWAFVPLMLPVEILTQLSRPLTLAFRLFGNVLGEDILIGTFALFGVTMFASLPIGIPLQMPFMLFALLTGTLQAFVFTLLSAIYILLAMPSEEEFEIIPD